MREPVVVLALDACDRELAERWGCQNLLLDDHADLETFAWSKEEPYTPEVWATVATGVMPDIHGIGHETQESNWDNPLLRAASGMTKHLSPQVRQALGRPFRAFGASQHFETVDEQCTTPFDATLSWPGVDDAEHLRQMWSLADEITRGEATTEDAQPLFEQLTHAEVGWLASRANGVGGCYGAHCHTLDIAGHLFCDREAELRQWYEWVDERVGWLREQVPRLVLLSDHGMQTAWTDDDDPGSHSWRSFIATQAVDDAFPEHVSGVSAWLTAQSSPAETQRLSTPEGMDTPKETLTNLGYLNA